MKQTVAIAMLLGIGLLAAGAVPALAQKNSSTAALSPQELAGKKLFVQRCSICHLPPLGRGEAARPFGPILKDVIKNAEAETRVRETIRKGTPRMPGFQYGLESQEIENIIAYLKTVR